MDRLWDYGGISDQLPAKSPCQYDPGRVVGTSRIPLSEWMWNFMLPSGFGYMMHRKNAMMIVDHANLELFCHTGMKVVEIGFSLSAIATWLNYLWKDKIRPDPKMVRTRNTSNIIWRDSKAFVGRRGCIATLLLSPLVHIAYVKYTQLTPAQIYERCVRIRHNKSSMHPDRLAFYWGAAGFIWRRTNGMMWGVALATLYGYLDSWLRYKPHETFVREMYLDLHPFYYDFMQHNKLPFRRSCDVLGECLHGSEVQQSMIDASKDHHCPVYYKE